MNLSAPDRTSPAVVVHPLDPADAAVTAAIREGARAGKGAARGPEARVPFDALMEGVPRPEGVTYETDAPGGVVGLWATPASPRPDAAILHLHGGWFSLGSATAYRHLVGHIAARAGARAFIPDYRRAPEHPFPAAPDDALACYQDLAQRGLSRIALTGDSAGGALALGLAARVTGGAVKPFASLAGVAVLSPVTDLTLSGASYETRAEADPFFTRAQVAALVGAYLGATEPTDPLASPLHGPLAGLPPVRLHVGDDEVLLDDARRYAERAAAAGVDTGLDVWTGMPHGFQASVGTLDAATRSLDALGAFLAERLGAPTHL